MELNIQNYSDFCNALLSAGFSMGGDNSEGIFSVIPWSWNDMPAYVTPVRWHTGDPETDPWEWRMRVLDERNDVAYAKLFFGKNGFITKDWYPCFLAVRRGGQSLDEMYSDGVISHFAKRIYDIILEHEALPLDEIKGLGGFSKADKYKFDKALTELQTKMFITMCGRRTKISQSGEEYGWSSTVFCTVECFFDATVFECADKLTSLEAIEKIKEQIYKLNPAANIKKIKKFIWG